MASVSPQIMVQPIDATKPFINTIPIATNLFMSESSSFALHTFPDKNWHLKDAR